MKKASKIFAAIVIFLVIIGLTLPMMSVFAQENLQTPLQEVENKVDELVQLKDDSSLSETDKETKEIQVRREALDKIVNLSLAEIKNLQSKLNSLELESDSQKTAKEKFLELLENNTAYSDELKKNITKENLTLDEIKEFAQDYKDWRENNYDVYVKKITAFTLVFQEKQVLKTANTRLDKIMSDLNKLEAAKILKKTDTSNLINLAMKSLANAQLYNGNAEKILLDAIKKEILDVATTTPALEMASSTADALIQTATSSPETLTKASEPEASTTPKIISEENKAQALIEKSLQEIKSAYANFIAISVKVSQRLKLK